MSPTQAINISQAFTDGLVVNVNVGQEVVVTTVDKLRICLTEHHHSIAARREWPTPLALLISLTATLLTADFHKFIFEADRWRSLFFVGAMFCGAWLIRAITRALKHRCPDPVGTIIKDVKASSSVVTAGPTAPIASPTAT